MFDDVLPRDFIVEWGDPREPGPPLFPEEEAVIAVAVAKRRLEFTRGRHCARSALRRLGLADAPLLPGSKGEPLWPPGVIGSITHTDELCLAAVGWKSSYEGVGIDVEPARPLQPAVAQRIATEAEMQALEGMSSWLTARLVFSAKEAFYKCQFHRTRAWLGFSDVSIELSADGQFLVRLLIDVGALTRGQCFCGSWRERNGFFFTAMWMPR